MATRLLGVYLLNLMDLVITVFWVDLYGIEIEANPIGRWLFQTEVVYPAKTIGVGALILVLYFALKAHPRWNWTSWLLLAAYATIAIYHTVLAAVYIL